MAEGTKQFSSRIGRAFHTNYAAWGKREVTDHSEDTRKRLSFSQREGKAALPDAMKLRHVPRRFRVSVWRTLYTHIRSQEFTLATDAYIDGAKIQRYISAYQEHIEEIYYDEIQRSPSSQMAFVRTIITDGEYHKILTLVEFLLRVALKNQDNVFHKQLLKAFEINSMAYFVDNPHEWPTVCPRQDKISGEVVADSLVVIREGDMAGAQKHLMKAAEFINEGRYGDSIVQSIHSIESVARIIAPEDCKTLDPALKSLERHEILNHRALKDAFSKLYGYTNDKQGLRHAVLDEEGSMPDLDEAVFFYGACACFAAYLSKKSRQITDE